MSAKDEVALGDLFARILATEAARRFVPLTLTEGALLTVGTPSSGTLTFEPPPGMMMLVHTLRVNAPFFGFLAIRQVTAGSLNLLIGGETDGMFFTPVSFPETDFNIVMTPGSKVAVHWMYTGICRQPASWWRRFLDGMLGRSVRRYRLPGYPKGTTFNLIAQLGFDARR